MKKFEKSVTSQWGEDGVIEEIFNLIGTKNKISVDIGAWDGKHFSNTWDLWHNKGWAAYLFESDRERATEAMRNCINFPVTVIQRRVNSLDKSLSENELAENIPIDFDLLCIDIDGDDYYLWQDMVKYKPRVVCIEYNQTVPLHISIVQERGGSFGASWKAMLRLALKKGYVLVHATVTNMIFVSEAEDKEGRIFERRCEFPSEWVSYVVAGYNGKQYRIGEPAHNDNQGGKHERLITDVKYTPI